MMRLYQPADVLLLSFPFSDTAISKRRPALVFLDTGDDDVVVARITSQFPQTKFDIQICEWQSAGLILPSVVRIHKLATLQKSLIQRQLGHLTTSDWENIHSAFQKIWELDVL